jgi:hypothetical protein
MDLSTKL